MADVTRILEAIEQGEAPDVSEQLLPLVYDELRELASQRMRLEGRDCTLQPTALVHEAYVRLVDVETAQRWNSRGHFFAAAAEAMRRILIERARRRGRMKRGGGRQRVDLDMADAAISAGLEDLMSIDEAIGKLESDDAMAAKLVRLHYYGGLSITDAGGLLGLSRSAAYELWYYARASLAVALG